MFPIIEALVVAHLRAATDGGAGVSTPSNLGQGIFHRVTRGPGSDDGITDSPLVDVETFAGSRLDAAQAAEAAREAMRAMKANAAAGHLIDSVDVASGPVWLDYENPKVHRYVASYRLTLRR